MDSETPWWKSSIVWTACVVTGVIVLLGLLSKWNETDKSYSEAFVKRVKMLIEQSTRWNTMAQQDTHPLVRLIHCNYALAYVVVARNLVSDQDIESITGMNIHELLYYLEECQSYAIKMIGQSAPALKVEGTYSAGSGWV